MSVLQISARTQGASPSQMSVVHVLAPARYGGLETVVAALVSGQQATGMRPQVLAIVEPDATDHPFVDALRRLDGDVETLVVPPRHYLAERRGVLEFCRRVQARVVHVHGARPDVLIGPAASRAGFSVVSTVHGFTGGDWKNRLYESLQRRALRRANVVVAVSRPLQQQLIRARIRPERVRLIPNAAPPPAARWSRLDARTELGIAHDGPVVAWVGRLTEEKGCDLFMHALAKMNRADVRISIIGSGPERARVERIAEEGGVASRTTWHGEVRSVGRLLEAFDLLVMSSRTEGTPMVLFEAIQAGVPVVATAVGGIPDVVSNNEAFLVAPDIGGIEAAMTLALGDAQERNRRAARARERIASAFSMNTWVEKYAAAYNAASGQ